MLTDKKLGSTEGPMAAATAWSKRHALSNQRPEWWPRSSQPFMLEGSGRYLCAVCCEPGLHFVPRSVVHTAVHFEVGASCLDERRFLAQRDVREQVPLERKSAEIMPAKPIRNVIKLGPRRICTIAIAPAPPTSRLYYGSNSTSTLPSIFDCGVLQQLQSHCYCTVS